MKARTDNMPERVSSHAVRGLWTCRYCNGLGARSLMLEFANINPEHTDDKYHIHTSCYAERHPETLHQLSPSNLLQLRLCDLQRLTNKQREKLLKAMRDL